MWQNILKVDKLQTGDVLETNSTHGICKHYAVVFYKNGIAYVTHNPNSPKRIGPIIETLEEFEKKRTIYNHFRDEITKKLTDQFIEDKAGQLTAYGFNFMEMNCEDYVRRIVGTYIGIDDRLAIIILTSLLIIIGLIITIVVLAKRK